MSGFLDTSVVVRYLTGDQPEMAERAASIIDGETELYVTDVVIAETAYVLTSVYRVPREAVVDHLMDLVQKRSVVLFGLDLGLVVDALLMCRPSGRVSFADAMVWASARSAGSETVYSLDKRFPDVGLKVVGRA